MTPRPKKPRTCCPFRAPGSLVFKPAGTPLMDLEEVPLGHDELEAMRLCDSVGLSQQEAGERMGVSRGTIQRMVARGRKKVIEAMIESRAIVVAPGDPPESEL